ncbi:YcbK family protein [Sphaerotilus uruguayifluvii]|uniref:Murein endopeptidase K n=1 Tax=Sphaerotilus uruguayifluvii TaxID=2735897 RepID=A0ABX2FYT1_9BURK|nr:DUF882 domain-containing protein [Leptothrix sp. C29]NRT54696.1 uncharacterized protein YcbK (DUF882 family) [Leptothrix sp. C29]
MTAPPCPVRRRLLHGLPQALALASAAALPTAVRAAPDEDRRLKLHHTHTGEVLEITYAEAGRWLDPALRRIDLFLRDHYSGAVGRIDPAVLDQIHAVQRQLGHRGAVMIVSGYRSPDTNEFLRSHRGGGVARHSLHMDGRAIDLRLQGVALAELHQAALSLEAGGVGLYSADDFVHLDTGRRRRWGA